MSEIELRTKDLMHKLSDDPDGTRKEVLSYIKTAAADEVKNTLHQLIDIDNYVKRYHNEVLIEVRKIARLTEIEMAKRWPANQSGEHRVDDRPLLAGNGENQSADRVAWNKIYKVSEADPEAIIAEKDATKLSRRAVMATVDEQKQWQGLQESAARAREEVAIMKERGPIVLGFEWGIEYQFLVAEQNLNGRKFKELMGRADGQQRQKLIAEVQSIFEKYFYPYFVEDVTNNV